MIQGTWDVTSGRFREIGGRRRLCTLPQPQRRGVQGSASYKKDAVVCRAQEDMGSWPWRTRIRLTVTVVLGEGTGQDAESRGLRRVVW